MKKLLLSICALVASATAWAGVETFDFTNPTELTPSVTPSSEASTGVDITGKTFTEGVISFSFTDGSTATRIWTGSEAKGFPNDLRMYKGATFTITSSTDNITGLTFDGAKVGDDLLSPNVGTYASKNWTGDAKSVTFSVSGTINVNTIKVTYGETPGPQPTDVIQLANVAAFNALAVSDKDKDVKFLNAVNVSAVAGQYVYVNDASGETLFYASSVDKAAELAAGDVLTGVTGKVGVYNGITQVASFVYESKAAGTPKTPATVTTATAGSKPNHSYVVFKSVSLAVSSGKTYIITDAAGTFQAYNGANLSFQANAGEIYDVEGGMTEYNGTKQITIVKVTKVGGEADKNYVASVAEFLSKAVGGDVYTFTCPLTVLTAAGQYTIVTDGTNNLIIYGTASGAHNGQVYEAGLEGVRGEYRGAAQLTNAVFSNVTDGTPVQPVEIVAADVTLDNLYEFVTIKGATLANNEGTDAQGNKFAYYNSCKITLPTTAADFVGFISVNNETCQFIPTEVVTGPVDPVEISNIGEMYEQADGTLVKVTAPLIVSYVYETDKAISVYVTDDFSSSLLYEKKETGKTALLADAKVGYQIPAGVIGKYNAQYSELEVTDGVGACTVQDAPTYDVYTLEELGTDLVNISLVIENATFTVNPEKDSSLYGFLSDETMQNVEVYNKFANNTRGEVVLPADGTTCDFYGTLGVYKNAIQIYLFHIENSGVAGVKNNVNANAARKVVENGAIYIEKDGVRFNLTGARVK